MDTRWPRGSVVCMDGMHGCKTAVSIRTVTPPMGVRCASFLRRLVAAVPGRSSPRHCCGRASTVGRFSLGGLFRPTALRHASAPLWGRPSKWMCTCSPAYPPPLHWPDPPPSLAFGSMPLQGPSDPLPQPPVSRPRSTPPCHPSSPPSLASSPPPRPPATIRLLSPASIRVCLICTLGLVTAV